jgi:hypothetical protein
MFSPVACAAAFFTKSPQVLQNNLTSVVIVPINMNINIFIGLHHYKTHRHAILPYTNHKLNLLLLLVRSAGLLD